MSEAGMIGDEIGFRVLGPVEVHRGGEPLALGGSTTAALLAGLLLSANRTVSVERLAEVVWDAEQPARPRAALHSVVSRLRRLLGRDIVHSLPNGYQLNADASQLDLLRSDELAAAAGTAARSGAHEQAAAALEEALALWCDPLLGNVNSAALRDEAVWLTEKYLAMQEHRADLCLRLGRHATVVEALPPLVRAHPFRERLVGQLMLALFHSGRQADALAAYESLRGALRDELGIDPGGWLQDLHLRLLRSDLEWAGGSPVSRQASPSASADAAGPRAGTGEAGTTAGPCGPQWRGRRPSPEGLVGRAGDIKTLSDAINSQRVVTLAGIAGVGKTSVALETAGRLTPGFGDGIAVVELGTLPAQPPGTGPWRHVMGDGTAAVVEAVRLALDIPAPPGQRPEAALTAGLARMELLLVLDNAEHVASACGWMVDLVVRSCPGVRVLTTSRRRLGLGAEAVVELAPLEPAPAAELLQLRAAAHRPGPGLDADRAGVVELCRLMEGLPLALELAAARLRTMSLRTLLERIGSGPDLLAVRDGAGLPHQRGLDATLRWSYDLLTEHGRLLLSRLAVFAGPFMLENAERVCGYGPLAVNDVAALLSGLVDDCMVHAARDRDSYCYRLLIPVRDFALAQASPSDLAAARGHHLSHLYEIAENTGYQGAARRLGSTKRGDGGQRDGSQRGSGEYRADIALRMDAFPDLLAAWDWALRGDASRAEAELGARLLLAARPAWDRRHSAAGAVLDHATRALSHPELLSAPVTAHVTLLAGNLHRQLGDPDAGRRLIEKALDLLERSDPGDRRARAAALSDLAVIAYRQVAPDAADLVRRSADAARDTGDRETIVVHLARAAMMLAVLGHLGEAMSLIEEAGAAAGEDRGLRLYFLPRRSLVLQRAGRVEEARRDTQQVLGELDGATSSERVRTLWIHGWAQASGGDFSAARRTLREALTLANQRQVFVLVPELLLALAYVQRASGRMDEAAGLIRYALRLALDHRDVLTGISALHLATAVACDTGNPCAAQIAAAVRQFRLRTGRGVWPLAEQEYARYERELGVDSSDVLFGPPEPGMFAATAELALARL